LKSWKKLEKDVAKALDGVRRVRYSYSESIEDVYHQWFTIECKWGKQVPAYCNVKHPTSNGEFDLIPSCDVMQCKALNTKIPPNQFEVQPIKRDKFIQDGLAQALGYNPDKVPLLCVKPSRYIGFVIILRHSDYLRLEGF